MNEQAVIIACPPASEEARRRCGITHFEPCAGIAETKCAACGEACLIGPNQRAHQQKYPESVVLCFLCSVSIGGPNQDVRSAGGTGSRYRTNREN